MVSKSTVTALIGVVVLLGWVASVPADETRYDGPLGLPSVGTLQSEIGLNDTQVRSCESVYESFKPRIKEAHEKGPEAKKALRKEIVHHLRAVCTEEQRPKFDRLIAGVKDL